MDKNSDTSFTLFNTSDLWVWNYQYFFEDGKYYLGKEEMDKNLLSGELSKYIMFADSEPGGNRNNEGNISNLSDWNNIYISDPEVRKFKRFLGKIKRT